MEGPLRGQRSNDKRSTSRPDSTYRPVEEASLEPEAPKSTYPSVSRPQPAASEGTKKNIIWPIIVAILVVLLCVTGWLAFSNQKGSTASVVIDDSKYQAVFFTNGQVYFGKLQAVNTDHMKLTDIYYLQSKQDTGSEEDSENPQKTSTEQSNVQLIKLGDEIHGPEDEMIISKAQVLFYENLKTDGKVAQSIEEYKSKKN